jgi:hypothetical protein
VNLLSRRRGHEKTSMVRRLQKETMKKAEEEQPESAGFID